MQAEAPPLSREWEARMLSDPKTVTPTTNPNHHTVGHRFKGWDGRTYMCIWYNERCGYQMVSDDGGKPHTTNVGERAIGRTYHIVR